MAKTYMPQGSVVVFGFDKLLFLVYPRICNPRSPTYLFVQKSVPFAWGMPQEDAFQYLRSCLCSSPLLALPDLSEGATFQIETDAAEVAVGAVLTQDQGKG